MHKGKKVLKSSGRALKCHNGHKPTHPIKDESQRLAFIDWFDQRYLNAGTPEKKRQADRNRMIILMALNTGLRAEDILQLTAHDVRGGRLCIKENKTGKSQWFKFEKDFADRVEEYVKRNKICENQYLFKSRQECSKAHDKVDEVSGEMVYYESQIYVDPVTRQRLNQVINQACREVGIDFTLGMHGLRKTFGWYCIAVRKINPLTVMKMYNHGSWATTARYIEWENDDLEVARSEMSIEGHATKARE